MSLLCNACGAQVATQYLICPRCGSRHFRPGDAVAAGQVSALQTPVLQPANASSPMRSSTSASWVVAPTSAAATSPSAGGVAYGGFWRRLAAYGIDIGLLALLFFGIGIVVGIVAPGADAKELEAAFNALGVLVFWVYYANMESGPRQATFGKRAMGLKVCTENGGPLSFGRASGRFFGKVLSGLFLGVGFLMIGFTDRKQGLHDKLASALVVRTR